MLDSLKDKLNVRSVKWFTDCQNIVSIVQKGSNVSSLHQLSLDIFWLCLHNSISLEIDWIPRDGTESDLISRIID